MIVESRQITGTIDFVGASSANKGGTNYQSLKIETPDGQYVNLLNAVVPALVVPEIQAGAYVRLYYLEGTKVEIHYVLGIKTKKENIFDTSAANKMSRYLNNQMIIQALITAITILSVICAIFSPLFIFLFIRFYRSKRALLRAINETQAIFDSERSTPL